MKKVRERANVKGIIEVWHYRGSQLLSYSLSHNLITDVGLNKMLDSTFHNDASSAWYVGLKLTGAVAAGDTLASHAGWTEFTDYTGNRQEYVEAAASGKSISNSASPAVFSITGTGAVTGAFLANVATGTAGILCCGGEFSTTKNVESGDTLNVVYTVSIADDGV